MAGARIAAPHCEIPGLTFPPSLPPTPGEFSPAHRTRGARRCLSPPLSCVRHGTTCPLIARARGANTMRIVRERASARAVELRAQILPQRF